MPAEVPEAADVPAGESAPATERFVAKIFIRGSIEAVWNEITKTDELQGAMFNMQLHTNGLRLGGHIHMRTANGRYTGVVGEILEYDPPRRYAHTFRFTRYDDPPCTITYDLTEVGDGVEFVLTADDVPTGTKTAKQLEGGGKFIASSLKSIVETGRPPLGVRILFVLFKLLEPFSPAKIRATNWTLPKN